MLWRTMLGGLLGIGVGAAGLVAVAPPAAAACYADTVHTGTAAGDEIEIASAADLQCLHDTREDWGKWFAQTRDIRWTGDAWTDHGIGTEEAPFTGSFDGGRHSISGLDIILDRDSEDGGINGGLFGNLEAGGVITGVRYLGDVTGRSTVGGLVGSASEATISDSRTRGTVIGRNYVGGLIGHTWDSTISDSSSSARVRGVGSEGDSVGGLIGCAEYGSITGSRASGRVSGRQEIGGLVGLADETHIIDSRATGTVSGRAAIGGLAGEATMLADEGDSGSIRNSHATGRVSGTWYIGGLVGSVDFTDISDSSSTGSVRGRGSVGALAGLAGSYTTIARSLASGDVTGRTDVGGLIGEKKGRPIKVSASYWDRR